MNKKLLKYYMETEPESTAKKYISLVDNQDIAMNMVLSDYQAVYLGQQEGEGYYSIDGFVGEMPRKFRTVSANIDMILGESHEQEQQIEKEHDL